MYNINNMINNSTWETRENHVNKALHRER